MKLNTFAALFFASTTSAHKVWKPEELEARLADPVTAVEIHALALSDLIASKSFFADTFVDTLNQCQGKATQLGNCLGQAGERNIDECANCMKKAADTNIKGSCNGYCKGVKGCMKSTCTSETACKTKYMKVVNCVLTQHQTGCSCASSSEGFEEDVVKIGNLRA